MKTNRLFYTLFTLFILLMLVLSSCNPCKRIAKYEHCFLPDTIKITDKVIHYETEYITNDSIIRDTIPCDPITNTVYSVRTVYKTNNKLIVDTIHQSTNIDRINPVNDVLKSDNAKLTNKVTNRNKVIGGMSLLIILLSLIVFIKIK